MPIQLPYTEVSDRLAAAAAANKEIVAAPAAGIEIVVWQMYITTDIATKFTFNSTEWEFNAPAAGTMIALPGGPMPLFVCTAATALTYTTDAAVTSFLKLWYTLA